MKSNALPFLLALLFALGPAGRAQNGNGDDAVKVTIGRNPDGTYTSMKTDPDTHSAESALYSADHKLLQTTVFDLDEQGRAVGGLIYAPKGTDPLGTLLSKVHYKYDTMNRVTEVDNYSPDDQLLSRLVYHYDPAGKVTKVDTYDGAGKLVSTATAGAPGKK